MNNQARTERHLDAVRRLDDHPGFSLLAPPKLRSNEGGQGSDEQRDCNAKPLREALYRDGADRQFAVELSLDFWLAGI